MKELQLPQLEYGYDELEPVIKKDILVVHHQKHHQDYTNNFNKFLVEFNKYIEEENYLKAQGLLPKLQFNLGGFNCHDLYWKNLSPIHKVGGILPSESSKLYQHIVQIWKSFDNFIQDFNQRTLTIQGSGWGWLALNMSTKEICIMITQNQDNVTSVNHEPLLTIDVWEHAYYLQYKNERITYLKEIWKIINWQEVEKRYMKYI